MLLEIVNIKNGEINGKQQKKKYISNAIRNWEQKEGRCNYKTIEKGIGRKPTQIYNRFS